MPVLIAIFLLLLTPLVMLLIRLWQPRFAFSWLIATAAALASWIIILAQQTHLPRFITLVEWKPSEFFDVSPALLLDQVSWPFALAVTSLTLAALLSDLARTTLPQASSTAPVADQTQQPTPAPDASEAPFSANDWWFWAAILTLGGLGLLAIMSANLLAVLLTWSAMDLVEIIIWLSQARQQPGKRTGCRVFFRPAGRYYRHFMGGDCC